MSSIIFLKNYRHTKKQTKNKSQDVNSKLSLGYEILSCLYFLYAWLYFPNFILPMYYFYNPK